MKVPLSLRQAISASTLFGMLAGVLALACLLLPSAAAAQGMPGSSLSSVNNVGGRRLPHNVAKPEIQPDALPGVKTTAGAAPMTKLPTDMAPTEALFDAINRGDISAARDAINRGADMNGHNILGMTPMELSVDLGRNDISFLLLSLRSENGPTAHGRPVEAAANAPPVPARTSAAAMVRSRPAAAKVAVQAPQAPATPRLFANDGGTPNPAAGFLGFDAARGGR